MDGEQAAIVVRFERVDMHPRSTDDDVVPDSIIIGNLRRINTRQHKQICDHCETIGGLRATISGLAERDALKTTAIDALVADIRIKDRGISQRGEMVDALEAELLARKEDSKVLMQVVEAIRPWCSDETGCADTVVKIFRIVEDYIDAPEIPDRGETGVITDQVIDEALDTIVSGMFNETAGAMQTAVADQDRRIKYLDAQIDKKSVFISSLLRNDKRLNRLLDGRRADVRGRDKIIESLRVDVADRDRHIEEKDVIIAKLRVDVHNYEVERNQLNHDFCDVNHNLHDANDKLNSVVDVLDRGERDESD